MSGRRFNISPLVFLSSLAVLAGCEDGAGNLGQTLARCHLQSELLSTGAVAPADLDVLFTRTQVTISGLPPYEVTNMQESGGTNFIRFYRDGDGGIATLNRDGIALTASIEADAEARTFHGPCEEMPE